MSCRTFLCLVSAALLALADQALALEASKATAIGSDPLVIKIEGRKGTRIYTPDESEVYNALVEGQEKAIATSGTTSKEKLDQCMASWDTKTHITKANWRTICQRELSDGSL